MRGERERRGLLHFKYILNDMTATLRVVVPSLTIRRPLVCAWDFGVGDCTRIYIHILHIYGMMYIISLTVVEWFTERRSSWALANGKRIGLKQD